MTREEVIKALDNCATNGANCADCPYHKDRIPQCFNNMKLDAAKLLEQGREKELSAPTETVVKYKIVNREDLLNAFHEYVYAQADFYMNYTGRAESPETARTCMSEICGAAVLMNNILNPRNEMLNSKPPEA